MTLREDWWTVCRMVDAHFGVSSCFQQRHRWGRVGKGMKEGQPQQVPSGACGCPNSSNRVHGEHGPWSNLCISLRCSCVQGDTAASSTPCWDWKHLSASLHKLSFLPARMCRRHICAKQHREVNSMSQHGWEMEPAKSLPQRSLAPTHAQKTLAQLWVFTLPMKSTLRALQVAPAAFVSQRDHPSCWQVPYKIPKYHRRQTLSDTESCWWAPSPQLVEFSFKKNFFFFFQKKCGWVECTLFCNVSASD